MSPLLHEAFNLAKMTKAAARKRMLEAKQKCLRVLFDAPTGIMFQKDMAEIEKVLDRVINRTK